MGDIQVQIWNQLERIWRRRWVAILIAWAICAVGWMTVLSMPNQYRSEARIYVDTTTLGPLLRGIVINQNNEEAVNIMTRTLLSRPNLEQVSRMTDLDVTATNPAQFDSLIQRLRSNTEIVGQERNLFVVAYEAENPILARNVVQSLLTIFVEGNLGRNRAERETARDFIGEQIDIYLEQLRTAEGKLASFKQKHINVLSDQGTFLSRLNATRRQLEEITNAYDEATTKRAQLKAQLAQTPRMMEIQTGPAIVVGQDDSPRGSLAARIHDLQQNLDGLLLRFTENHPDVVAAKRTLAQLTEQYENTDGNGGPSHSGRSTVPNPVHDQISLHLLDAETEVASLKRRVDQARARVEQLEASAQTAPQLEAELADLNRDYDIIKAKYEDLLVRRESARLAEAVEAKSDNIQFDLIDPPQVPTAPSAPNRQLLMFVVLGLGIGAGIGFAFLRAQFDDSFQVPEDLKEAFGLPVLGSVSALVSHTEQRRRRADYLGFGAVALSLFVIFGGLLLVLPQLTNLVGDFSLPDFFRE